MKYTDVLKAINIAEGESNKPKSNISEHTSKITDELKKRGLIEDGQ